MLQNNKGLMLMETRVRAARSSDNGAGRNVAPQPEPAGFGLPTCWSAALRELRCSCFPPRGRLAYTCSMAVDFGRLLLRICSVVNWPPQTLQRQPGDAACAITGTDC